MLVGARLLSVTNEYPYDITTAAATALTAYSGNIHQAAVTSTVRIIETSPKKPVNFNYYHTGQRRSVPAEHKEMTMLIKLTCRWSRWWHLPKLRSKSN